MIIENKRMQQRRGLRSEMTGLLQGEFGVTTDEEKVYIRINQNNVELANKSDLDDVSQQLEQSDDILFKQSLVNHKAKKRYILWFDDDGHKGVYTKLAPLLREYGIKLTSAIITNRPHGFPIAGLPPYNPFSDFMSYEQMQELHEEGIVEFVSHTHTHDLNHRLTDMTVEEIHADLSLSQSIIRQLGYNYRHLPFPFGSYNNTVIDVTRQYFESSFTVNRAIVTNPMNQFTINRVGLDSMSFADIKPYLDQAIAGNTGMVMTSHVDQYGDLNLSVMRQIIEYALTNDFTFVTTDEFIGEYGNLAQFGETVIDNEGEIHGDVLGTYRIGKAGEYEPNAPITDFKKGKTTIVKVRLSEAEGYNLAAETGITSLYGKIEVQRDRDGEDAFSYQLFTSTNRNKQPVELIRRWNTSTSAWATWSNITGLETAIFGEYTNNAPVTEFPKGKVTRVKVRTVDSPSYGLTGFGILEVYRDSNEDTYSYQIYRNLLTNRESTRKWDTANSNWTAFSTNLKELSTLTRTINATISEHSTYETSIDISNIKTTDIHIVVLPALPTGIISGGCYVPYDGRVTVRLGNITNSSIALNNFVVQVKRLG